MTSGSDKPIVRGIAPALQLNDNDLIVSRRCSIGKKVLSISLRIRRRRRDAHVTCIDRDITCHDRRSPRAWISVYPLLVLLSARMIQSRLW